MTDDDPPLKAVLDRPEDDEPRERYAAWCGRRSSEEADSRAEFIRLQMKLQRKLSVLPYPESMDLRRKESALLERFGKAWAGEIAGLARGWGFRRGFVEEISTSASAFIAGAATMFASAPIRHLDVVSLDGRLEEFCSRPELLRLHSLSLGGTDLEDEDAKILAGSRNLANVWWLDLGRNRLTMSGIEHLAAAKGMPRLAFVELGYNPSDPRETIGVEGEHIVSKHLPPEGRALESRHGPLRWLHCPTDAYIEFPPNRREPPAAYRAD